MLGFLLRSDEEALDLLKNVVRTPVNGSSRCHIQQHDCSSTLQKQPAGIKALPPNHCESSSPLANKSGTYLVYSRQASSHLEAGTWYTNDGHSNLPAMSRRHYTTELDFSFALESLYR